MRYNTIVYKLSVILSPDDYERIGVWETEDGWAVITMDIHGLSKRSAERLIKNVINVNRGAFILSVIHGYNRGTILKEMLLENSWNHRVIDRRSPAWNPGKTYMTIEAA